MKKITMVLVISLACIGAYVSAYAQNINKEESVSTKCPLAGTPQCPLLNSKEQNKNIKEFVTKNNEKVEKRYEKNNKTRNSDGNGNRWWMRDVSRDKQRDSKEHIQHSRGLCKGAEGTDGRNHERIRGDWERSGKDRRGSKFNSKRHCTSSRGQKLQHRPDSREHRGLSRGNQRDCGRCTKGTDKDRRISRRFGASKHKSFSRNWSDRGTRGTGQRVRTVR